MRTRELAHFTVELESDLSPGNALRRILDLRQHTRVIPFTTVTPALPAESLRPGTEFVARTGLGPVGFDDVMRVEAIDLGDGESLASAHITKDGRAIHGSIRVVVRPARSGSLVNWRQEVRLPWLPGLLQRPAARVLRLGYRGVLAKLLASGR